MAKPKNYERQITERLVAQVGTTMPGNYLDGKRALHRALDDILDDRPEEPAAMFQTLERGGYLRFVNRAGFDADAALWRVTPNPL